MIQIGKACRIRQVVDYVIDWEGVSDRWCIRKFHGSFRVCKQGLSPASAPHSPKVLPLRSGRLKSKQKHPPGLSSLRHQTRGSSLTSSIPAVFQPSPPPLIFIRASNSDAPLLSSSRKGITIHPQPNELQHFFSISSAARSVNFHGFRFKAALAK